MKTFDRASQKQYGFTLIELVIVLAVLGALSAIAIPQLTGLENEAELQAIAASASSEINNAFARDLAAGEADDTFGGTGVNWGDDEISCQAANIWGEDNPETNANLVFESLVGYRAFYGVNVDPPNAAPITVPTYVSGVIGSSRNCYIRKKTAP